VSPAVNLITSCDSGVVITGHHHLSPSQANCPLLSCRRLLSVVSVHSLNSVTRLVCSVLAPLTWSHFPYSAPLYRLFICASLTVRLVLIRPPTVQIPTSPSVCYRDTPYDPATSRLCQHLGGNRLPRGRRSQYQSPLLQAMVPPGGDPMAPLPRAPTSPLVLLLLSLPNNDRDRTLGA